MSCVRTIPIPARRLAIVLGLLAASVSGVPAAAAAALERDCEAFIAAAEKSAPQPARHSLVEVDGDRIEAIAVDGRFYSGIGGRWRLLTQDPFAADHALNAAIRSGEIGLENCRFSGSQNQDGIQTRSLHYTLRLPGAPPADSTAHIGADGLVHGLTAGGTQVRFRYTGVTAPRL